ncbi:MAG: hypothetical protein WA655_13890 [Candidatus Korobacteraceae bacterium]
MFIYPARNFALTFAVSALLTTGCNNGRNTDSNYKAAIDDHFKAFPACIWSQPKKLPVQAATSDGAKTQGYDALTQEGLLTRSTAEEKVLIFSKQVNNYDLSDKGRSTWTPHAGTLTHITVASK